MSLPRLWDRAATLAAAALIALAALAAYHNTFGVPFLFDDGPAIIENPGIRRLWPLWDAFRPQAVASTVDGRPVANFTLAINYALSGTGVWSYHVLNLLIHILAGLTLFGIVRRTLRFRSGQAPVNEGRGRRTPPLSERAACGDAALQTDATPIALAVALLWTLHPLQTEAVTYVVQRVESLMGLFYLLTLYCFIRAVEGTTRPLTTDQTDTDQAGSVVRGRWSGGPASSRLLFWYALSILCCLLGMATKEVMVTAPLLVFLYDRAFVAGTFRDAWRRRWRLHLGLASTWLLLVVLVAGTGWNRGGAAGFNVGVTPWEYWLTQFEGVARYLWLTVWPHPQVFDYGTFWVRTAGAVVPFALIVVPFAMAAVWAHWHAPIAGFLGAWFFGILAVTSVVPGTIQMIVEHRMYLPLAAPITAAVLGLHALLRRATLTLTFTFILAVALGLLTEHRNTDYRSELALWEDTVAKRPDSPRARNSLAFALDHAGRTEEAIQQFETALRRAPDNAELYDNLGVTLAGAGRTAEAIARFETALRLRPDFPVAHSNLGNALVQSGDTAAAIGQFEEALRLRPDYAEAHYNLGGALDHARRTTEALGHLETAVRLKPDFTAAHYNLGDLLDRLGRTAEAKDQYEQALQLEPGMAQAQLGLGVLLCRSGQTEAGLTHLREAVRILPDSAPARFNLGVALMRAGRTSEAIEQYTAAVRLQPDAVHAHFNLGEALRRAGRINEAAAEYEEVLRLHPDHAAARRILEVIRTGLPAGPSSP